MTTQVQLLCPVVTILTIGRHRASLTGVDNKDTSVGFSSCLHIPKSMNAPAPTLRSEAALLTIDFCPLEKGRRASYVLEAATSGGEPQLDRVPPTGGDRPPSWDQYADLGGDGPGQRSRPLVFGVRLKVKGQVIWSNKVRQ